MTCKTCRWLDVPPDKAGRIVVRKGNAYRCLFPEIKAPDLPDCITTAHDWRWPPSRSYMTVGGGHGCPMYSERAAAIRALATPSV